MAKKTKVTDVLDRIKNLESDLKVVERIIGVSNSDLKWESDLEKRIDLKSIEGQNNLKATLNRISNTLYAEKLRLQDIISKTEVEV